MQDAFGVSKGVGSFFDRRALKVASQLAPEGSALANGAQIGRHSVSRSKLGFRKVTTTMTREGKEIGQVKSAVSPTKHVVVTDAKVAQAERGKGVGTSALKTITGNAPKSKTPGVYWWSQGGGGTGYTGSRAWKRGDAKYVRGVPFMPGSVSQALKGSSESARKQGMSFQRKARLGLVKPSQMRSKAPEAADAMNDLPWAARVKGGQPFGRKTAYAVGGGGAAAGAETARRKKKTR
jgi:hypothetical protein